MERAPPRVIADHGSQEFLRWSEAKPRVELKPDAIDGSIVEPASELLHSAHHHDIGEAVVRDLDPELGEPDPDVVLAVAIGVSVLVGDEFIDAGLGLLDLPPGIVARVVLLEDMLADAQ